MLMMLNNSAQCCGVTELTQASSLGNEILIGMLDVGVMLINVSTRRIHCRVLDLNLAIENLANSSIDSQPPSPESKQSQVEDTGSPLHAVRLLTLRC